MRELTITSQEEGQRLDRYLSRYLPDASSGFLHKMLRKKNIKCNDKKASGAEKLRAGDRIQIYFSEETLIKLGASRKAEALKPSEGDGKKDGLTGAQKALRQQIRILFKNEDVVILHKPAGMLTQKASPSDDSLNDYLMDYWREEIMDGRVLPASFKPSVANRLDRNTSGIVLCGISVKGLQALSGLLKNRRLEKYYLCIVKGRVSGRRKIYGYLKKDETKNRVMLTEHKTPGSVRIETWYRALSCGEAASLLKVRLITGRSHQIRAHLASAGHPVLGDGKYGDPGINRKLRNLGIRYQLLHSSELVIPEKLTDAADEAEHDPAVSRLLRQLAGLHIIDDPPEAFGRVIKEYGLKKNTD